MRTIIIPILWFLEAVKWLMLARAVISWVPDLSDPRITKIIRFLDDVTEPFIAPIRDLISKTRLAELPIDMSFLIAYMILQVMTGILSSAF